MYKIKYFKFEVFFKRNKKYKFSVSPLNIRGENRTLRQVVQTRGEPCVSSTLS